MTSRILALTACLVLSSCFTVHRMDVQQGNYVDQELVGKLKPEMTRSQVKFLLGTPLITDPFHPERWDYLYLDRRGGRLKQERRLTLWFEGDKLKRAMTDAPGVASPLQAAVPQTSAEKGKTPTPGAEPEKSSAPAPAALTRAPGGEGVQTGGAGLPSR
jgi:outer membrane protein assembly factor BamE